MKRLSILLLIILSLHSCSQKNKSILLDYDTMPSTKDWWRFNEKVEFKFIEGAKQIPTRQSKAYLNVQWPYSSKEGAYTWFTDLKVDSLRNPEMLDFRKAMGNTIWLSFWCRVNSNDSLYLHPMVLSYNHKGKWGSKDMTLITSKEWTFCKYNLSSLKYEKWGKDGGDQPNFATNEVRCFEVGLRKGATISDGKIDADFDNLMITNFEPKGDE